MKSESVSQWVSESVGRVTVAKRLECAELAPAFPLPKNISAKGPGYRVRIERAGIFYQAYARTVAEAIRLRDRFIAIHGAIKKRGPSSKPYSNTGLVGISESVTWYDTLARPHFIVSCHSNFRRRIYINSRRTRSEALAQAVALRAQILNLKS